MNNRAYIPADMIDRESIFRECWEKKYITVDPNNPYFDSRNDCNAVIDSRTNELIRGSGATVIPDTVVSIGKEAFNRNLDIEPYDEEGPTSLVIPDSVTSIGELAFGFCDNLVDIVIPDSVIHIGKNAFVGCGFKSIKLPKKLKVIPESVFWNCQNLEEVYINESVEEIHNFAFQDCKNLKYVHIPASVKKIGNRAFDCECKRL